MNIGAALGIALVVAFLCGLIASAIAGSRGVPTGIYFFLGFFLGVIGIILAAIASPRAAAPQPPGWYSDPWGHAWYRWWDGYQWTYHSSDGAPAAGDSLSSGHSDEPRPRPKP